MKKCVLCDTEIQDEAMKCKGCGAMYKRCPMCAEWNRDLVSICVHCDSDFTQQVATSKGDLGTLLMVTPLIGAALAFFWVGQMNFLQDPQGHLRLIILGVVLLTATLAAIETRLASMRNDSSTDSYSPMAWFFIITLLWVIGYPAYLKKRQAYGFDSYLTPGLLVGAIFVLVVYCMNAAWVERENDLRLRLDNPTENSRSIDAN